MNNGPSIWSRLADVASLVATPLAPSHYLALVSPLAATHALQARVVAVRDETADARTLTLRPGRGWRPHRAGQHVRVSLAIDGRIATRTYSISSSPDRRDGRIEITVKAVLGGRVSPVLAREVRPGAVLSLGQPEGALVGPVGGSRPALFVTAGSGITPIASMVRTFAARGAMPDVAHLHYAPTGPEVIFGDELRALAAAHPWYRLIIVHTRDDPRRVSADRLDELVPDWRTRETWACAPRGLLEAIAACFEREGRTSALHIERFGAAIVPVPASATGGRVRFEATGTATRADGRTPLLRVAEAAGVHAPHGCRMGICHTCDATLLSGCVRDLRTGDQIDEPGRRIQICVCAAAGDVDLAL